MGRIQAKLWNGGLVDQHLTSIPGPFPVKGRLPSAVKKSSKTRELDVAVKRAKKREENLQA